MPSINLNINCNNFIVLQKCTIDISGKNVVN